MNRPHLRFLLAIALAAAAAPVVHAVAPAAEGPVYTKDRVSAEQMEAMVAGPLAQAEAGRLEAAQQAFEALLARSSDKDKPDLLTSFGVGLYKLALGFEEDKDDRIRRASLPYLERAIPATAARFGAGHPETALALTTYADAMRELSPDNPPRQVDELYQHAYDIRRHTLGPNNAETLYTLLRLAQMKGHPSRTAGDPAKIVEAAGLFDQVIKGRQANPDQPDYEPPEEARYSLIEMYVRNGQVDQALATARAGDAIVRAGEPHCPIGPHHWALSFALAEAGREAEAKAVLTPAAPQPPECEPFPPVVRIGQ